MRTTPPQPRHTGRTTALTNRALPVLAFCLATLAHAQRHSGLSSPPTAPPQTKAGVTASKTIFPVSSGLGALQFTAVNYGVPAPQSLTRQLEADDERTRAAALSAIGSPGQYLVRGHVPYPHSIQLNLAALGLTEELDAVLTVELDHHLVSAILVPHADSWYRVATLTYATPFADPATTPDTFLHIARSLMQHERYRAVYRATTTAPNGDLTANEAHLRVLNSKAVVLISFVSAARACTNVGKRPGCDLTHRWMQPDPADPTQRFLLVTAFGRTTARDAADPLADTALIQQSHLHRFDCQPFVYSDASQRYEPVAPNGLCPAGPAAPAPAR